MEKTVYLHIGSPKTGTSALQYFFLQNRPLLRRGGIEYPEHLVDANGISSGNAELLVRDLKASDTQAAARFVESVLAPGCPGVLLSSEYFYRLPPEGTAVLADLLAGVQVRVIVYIRRQDSVLMSAYNQGIKRAGRTRRLADWYRRRLKKERSTYEEVLKWGRAFGSDRMLVRVYEKQQFTGGTIFSDFMDVLGLPLTDAYTLPSRRINPSYRVDALEMMRLLNYLPLPRETNPLDTLLQHYSDSLGNADDWPYELMSPAQRLEIIRYYADSNARLAREFLGRADGRLFLDPLPDAAAPWQPYPGLSAADVERIAAFIAAQDTATAHQVGRAIREGLRSDDADVRAAAQTLSAGRVYFGEGRSSLRDTAAGYIRQNGRLRSVFDRMPVKLKKPIAAAARKLRIIH